MNNMNINYFENKVYIFQGQQISCTEKNESTFDENCKCMKLSSTLFKDKNIYSIILLKKFLSARCA